LGPSEPTCADIDVPRCTPPACAAETWYRRGCWRRDGGRWRIEQTRRFEADILVDAAAPGPMRSPRLEASARSASGPIAARSPRLRSSRPRPADLPLVIDAASAFYFKPEAGGRLWLSPHDETPSEPCDCAPEELDVAIAIDRLERVVDWRVEAVERKWAGLRSFAPDRLPVYGFSRRAGLLLVRGAGRLSASRPRPPPAARRRAAARRPRRRVDPAPYRAARFRELKRGGAGEASARSFSGWPLWPFTQCHSIRCGARLRPAPARARHS
jgi:D-arginine dehydrogenase